MEIDFLIRRGGKICPVEVKSSRYATHASLDKFRAKFGDRLGESFLLYAKDLQVKDGIVHLPIYMAKKEMKKDMKMKSEKVSVLRSICAVGVMAFAAIAEAEIVKEYTLTDSLTATLDDQGVLTIIGSGAMPDWESGHEQAWHNEHSQIKSVVAEGEISLGRGAFLGCDMLTSVVLPNATTIGQSAFEGCIMLTSVVLPKATTIGQSAFWLCPKLTSVSLPKATTIGQSAFLRCARLTSVFVPNATTIGEGAFADCEVLKTISLLLVSSIGQGAFSGCQRLSSVLVNHDMFQVLVWNVQDKEKGFGYYGIDVFEVVTTSEPLSEDLVKNAGFVVQEAVVDTNVQAVVSMDVKVYPSVTLKSGDTVVDEAAYKVACVHFGVEAQTKPETPTLPDAPSADDYKVVSKDAQVVQKDEIAVKKESIQAPSAGTVKVEDNKVQLGVAVLKTSDLTAEKKNWNKVKISKDDIDVDADGNIIVNVPVDSASGFMVIQTKDAKVGQ